MTWEEIQAGLAELVKDDKAAEPFKTFVKTLGFETPEDIEALKRNRNDLLVEKKEISNKYNNVMDKLKILDIDDLDAYIDSKSQGDSKNKGTHEDIQNNPLFKRLKSDLETKDSDFKSLNAKYENALKKSQISEALEAAGFIENKELMERAFKADARVEYGEKDQIIFENEKGIPLPAKQFFAALAETKEWGRYKDQPTNSGAKTQGFNGAGNGGKTVSRSAYQNMSMDEQLKFTSDGGTITD